MSRLDSLYLVGLGEDGAPQSIELPHPDRAAGWTLQLAGLPGATAVQLVIAARDAGALLQAEIECQGSERFSVRIEPGPDDRLRLSTPGRRAWLMPPDSSLEPNPALRTDRNATMLDLALVVDGTARIMAPEQDGLRQDRPYLLADPERWPGLVALLVELIELLGTQYEHLSGTVLAFADHHLPGVNEPGLDPGYLLSPSSRGQLRLGHLVPAELEAALLGLEPSPGLDYVDAVAEALAACTELQWREGSRRIVILLGDSPGYSFLDPAPAGSDINQRDIDIDTTARTLHGQGVEIITIFHPPLPGSTAGDHGAQRALIDHTRAQYQSLASLPGYAVTTDHLDPTAMTARIMERPELIARGSVTPRVDQVEPC